MRPVLLHGASALGYDVTSNTKNVQVSRTKSSGPRVTGTDIHKTQCTRRGAWESCAPAELHVGQQALHLQEIKAVQATWEWRSNDAVASCIGDSRLDTLHLGGQGPRYDQCCYSLDHLLPRILFTSARRMEAGSTCGKPETLPTSTPCQNHRRWITVKSWNQ
jgi:hypothetical protein